MSFSWCAHQQEWKPHLSSFGVIENRSLGNSVELSAFFAVKKNSWRKAARTWGADESCWAVTPTLSIAVHRVLFHLLASQYNLLPLLIRLLCGQDINMPLTSANTIMKTDICNCICMVSQTQNEMDFQPNMAKWVLQHVKLIYVGRAAWFLTPTHDGDISVAAHDSNTFCACLKLPLVPAHIWCWKNMCTVPPSICCALEGSYCVIPKRRFLGSF